jgi:hypothetical protein
MDGSCSLTVRVKPIPDELLRKLEELSSEEVKWTLQRISQLQEEEPSADKEEGKGLLLPTPPSSQANKTHQSRAELEKQAKENKLNEIASSLYAFLKQASSTHHHHHHQKGNSSKQGQSFKIESYGPKGKGVNLLVIISFKPYLLFFLACLLAYPLSL